jgi:mRNA interferase RelE/StbE
VPFTLVYHAAVAREDLPAIPANVRRRIADAIETRLTGSPQQFAVPLRKTLKGYWKLRVGDYRVVFAVMAAEVRILAIRHRKHVYEDAEKRVGRSR